jgi:hypothetical protein
MKSTNASLPFLAAAAMALSGCEGVHYANFLTLVVTFGLFVGTLNLGRRPANNPARANAATTSTAPKG